MGSRVALTPKEWGIPEIISLDATINKRLLGLWVTLDKGPRSTKIGYQFGRFAMKQQNWVPVWKICNETTKLGISLEYLQ